MSAFDRKNSQPIKVYARQRPMSLAEIQVKAVSVVNHISARELFVKSGVSEKKYVFDRVFDGQATQEDVYKTVAAPLINNVIAGYNCTIFAHGQTNSGKTHTLLGELKDGILEMNESSVGLVARSVSHLFSELSKLNLNSEYTVRVSFVELFNEEVRDLLRDNSQLRIYDDPMNRGSVCIKDLSHNTVFNVEEVIGWINIGLRERQKSGSQNGRSHSIFTITVDIKEVTNKVQENKTGRLHFVNLAGSEHASRHCTLDSKIREAASINRAIVTLGKVIKALGLKLQHIPYRDSKLTRILQDSLGGNAKTCMIATFSPSLSMFDETVNTLDLAQLTKSICNTPQVNVNKKQANLMAELEDEIARLRIELDAAIVGRGYYLTNEAYAELQKDNNEFSNQMEIFVKKLQELEDHKNNKELDYRKLGFSFEKTKEHFVNAMKQLELKQKEVEEKNKRLNKLSQYKTDLQNTAHKLLEVCENSTKHANIYHQKLQDKANSNLTNAKLSSDIAALAIGFLREIKNLTQSIYHQQNEITKGIKEANRVLHHEHTADIEKSMNNFSSNLLQKTQTCKIEADKILKDKFSTPNIQNFLEERYEQTKEQVMLQAKTLHSLSNLKLVSTDYLGKISQKAELLDNSMKAFESQSREEMISNEALLLDLRSKQEEMVTEKIETQKKDNELLQFSRNVIQNCIRESEQLTKQKEEIASSILSIKAVVEERKKKKKMLEKNRQQLTEYFNMVALGVAEQKAVTETISSKMTQNINSMRKQAATSEQETQQWSNDLLNCCSDNLKESTEQYQSVLDKLSTECQKLSKLINERIGCMTQNIGSNLNKVDNVQKQYVYDMDNFIQQALNNMANLSNGISFVGHTGDTPAKMTYDYPKKVDSMVCQALEELFSDHEEEAPEQNMN